MIINKNCVLGAGTRIDHNVQLKEGTVLAKNTLASCHKVTKIHQSMGSKQAMIEFGPVTEIDETCFEKGAIVADIPPEMRLKDH